MDERNMKLEIAKLIGEPINPALPTPVALSAIADLNTAVAGEKVYYFASEDSDIDEIYEVNTSTGKIVLVKKEPLSDTALTFTGLNSRKQYVLLDTVLSSPDVEVLGRKKASISRGMDKLELKRILDAIIALGAVDEIDRDSGEDLYDVIMKAKHALEDYGDNYALLCGSSVKEAIDNYDKKKAGTFQYNVTLPAKLKELGIDVMKIWGTVKTGTASANEDDISGSGAERLLATDKFIMVARNSTIAKGKPIIFVRRLIPANIAKMMGAEVDSAQRMLSVSSDTVNVAGTDTLGYSVYGYESCVLAITNARAIKKSVALADIL